MSEPNGPWRLLYKNDSNVNTILGVMGDVASSAFRLKQARWKAKARAFGKISFIAEKNIYKSIPQDTSDFGTTEPGIYWQGLRFNKTVQAVDTSTDTFTVSGDVTNDFEEGGAVEVNESSRSDDGTIYKVQSPDDVTYDSNNDETSITVVEDVTDSTVDGNLEGYENIFRGFAQNQGQITENGNVKFTLFSFLRRIAQENVTISSTSDIQDVMSKLTPSGYTFDSPASSNVTYVDSTGTIQTGYAPVDDYSLTDVDRAVGFREKIRNYGYVVKLKAHKELRFEPVGFGSSIDTIESPAEGDTSNTRGNWIEWVAGDTNVANLTNTVRVVNSKTGTKYDSGIITNSSSVQKHGKITPKGGNPVQKGYVSSNDEAKRVAQNIIRDSQNPDEGGRVKVPGRYTNDVTNSTFNLNDSVRGIDNETFVAWSQVNFYPENKTILEFEYENQSEKETNITDDVRAERSTVFADDTTDAGQQSFTGDTGSAPSDTATTGGVNDNASDTSLIGDLNTNDVGEGIGQGVGIIPKDVSAFSSVTIQREVVQSATEIVGGGTVEGIYFKIDYLNQSGQSISVDYEVTNTTTNTQLASGNFNVSNGSATQVSFVAAGPDTGDNIEAFIETVGVGGGAVNDIETASGANFFTRIDFTTASFSAHSHGDTYNTDDNQHGHGDNIDTDDFSHGGSGDATGQHGTSGTTDSKNIEVTTEDKTDRS